MTTTQKHSDKIPTAKEIQQLHRDAAGGVVKAQYKLGFLYAFGKGVPENPVKAFELTRKAADWGHAGAQYAVGTRYVYGRGVEKDNAKAVHYYELAAKQGNKNAQFWLGFMLANGYGAARDYENAYLWLERAAKQGVENAGKLQTAIISRMTNAQLKSVTMELDPEYLAEVINDAKWAMHEPEDLSDRYEDYLRDDGRDEDGDNDAEARMESIMEMYNEGDLYGWY